jgi:hypothetical protein
MMPVRDILFCSTVLPLTICGIEASLSYARWQPDARGADNPSARGRFCGTKPLTFSPLRVPDRAEFLPTTDAFDIENYAA